MKTPSSLRTRRKDFSQGGFHAEPHDFHRLWFEFLLLSPSYELARRFRASNGSLSPGDQARLPADFDQVLDVFDDFGDLQRSLFRPWLLERGLRLFGAPGAKPQPKLLHRLRDGDEQEVEAASQNIKHYIVNRPGFPRHSGAVGNTVSRTLPATVHSRNHAGVSGLCRILCKRTFGRKLPPCPEPTCLPRNTPFPMNS